MVSAEQAPIVQLKGSNAAYDLQFGWEPYQSGSLHTVHITNDNPEALQKLYKAASEMNAKYVTELGGAKRLRSTDLIVISSGTTPEDRDHTKHVKIGTSTLETLLQFISQQTGINPSMLRHHYAYQDRKNGEPGVVPTV